MAKLTANGRKHIKSTNYGLPKDKKYPLNDEQHVRSAIQMFAYCPSDKKATLARNIKRRIGQLHMDIQVSKGSAFYDYAGKYKKK